jgi:hypothetical protein
MGAINTSRSNIKTLRVVGGKPATSGEVEVVEEGDPPDVTNIKGASAIGDKSQSFECQRKAES